MRYSLKSRRVFTITYFVEFLGKTSNGCCVWEDDRVNGNNKSRKKYATSGIWTHGPEVCSPALYHWGNDACSRASRASCSYLEAEASGLGWRSSWARDRNSGRRHSEGVWLGNLSLLNLSHKNAPPARYKILNSNNFLNNDYFQEVKLRAGEWFSIKGHTSTRSMVRAPSLTVKSSGFIIIRNNTKKGKMFSQSIKEICINRRKDSII